MPNGKSSDTAWKLAQMNLVPIFRAKFEALNRVTLTDGESARLLEESIAPDVFTAAKTLRSINAFTRDDVHFFSLSASNGERAGVRCRNDEPPDSHHRYDVLLLINGVHCVQVELKTLGISPRRAMEQSSNTRTTPATATPARCSASSSFSSSAIATRPSTSPTTTPVTSPSTRTNL
jgi:hypothetical protein